MNGKFVGNLLEKIPKLIYMGSDKMRSFQSKGLMDTENVL